MGSALTGVRGFDSLAGLRVATYAVKTMSQRQTHEDGPNILADGAEIHFTDDRDAHRADRVEFLRGGWVKAIYKEGYQLEVYPPDVIQGVYTHTNHLEDKDWW